MSAYDTDPVPERDELGAAVEAIRGGSRKHVWPWVFTNRFIGRGEGPAHDGAPDAEYFRRIRGWDLNNETSALADFYAIWRLSLRLARDLEAPGVVLDLEAYNDYRTYDVDCLAQLRGESADRIVSQLQAVGCELARIVVEEYREAVVWSLFTHLGAEDAAEHICRGMLEALAAADAPAVLVDGGEMPLGYYSPSAEALERKLASFADTLRPFMDQFPRHLRMGGTLAPYHGPGRLKSWIKEASEQGGRTYRNAAEFRPLVDALFRECGHVWIYGASAAGCVPFNPANAATTEAVHEMLTAALGG